MKHRDSFPLKEKCTHTVVVGTLAKIPSTFSTPATVALSPPPLKATLPLASLDLFSTSTRKTVDSEGLQDHDSMYARITLKPPASLQLASRDDCSLASYHLYYKTKIYIFGGEAPID